MSFTYKNTKLLLLVIVASAIFSAWLSGHYGLWPLSNKVHNKYASDLRRDIEATQDPRLCRGLINPEDRYECEIGTPHIFAYQFRLSDCMSNSNFLTRDICLAETVSSYHIPHPNECNFILDAFYRRFCHFTMQPGELLTLGGLTTWIEGILSLLLFVVLLYFVCDFYVTRWRKYPGAWASAGAAFIIWIMMSILTYINAFGILPYHLVIIERIGCPPNTGICASGGGGFLSFSFPTPWGLFVTLLLMPLIYFFCIKLVAWLHKLFGNPILITLSTLSYLVSKKHTRVLLLIVAFTYLASIGYGIYAVFEPLIPPTRSVEYIARSSLDMDICSKINNEKTKTACKDSVMTGIAAEKIDSSYCDKIVDIDQEKACKLGVEDAQQSKTMAEIGNSAFKVNGNQIIFTNGTSKMNGDWRIPRGGRGDLTGRGDMGVAAVLRDMSTGDPTDYLAILSLDGKISDAAILGHGLWPNAVTVVKGIISVQLGSNYNNLSSGSVRTYTLDNGKLFEKEQESHL